MKARKPSLKALKADLVTSRELCDLLRTQLYQVQKERDQWKATAQSRLDTQMLDARVALANAIGQMAHQVSESIKYVIGKEVL